MDPLSPADIAAISLHAEQPAVRMGPSELQWIKVDVTNDSNRFLSAALPFPIKLAFHWFEYPSGTLVLWEGARTELVPGLSPHSRGQWAMRVIAPHQLGQYLLQVTLVQESYCWFEAKNPNSAQNFVVTVRSEMATHDRFSNRLFERLLDAQFAHHTDNYDTHRFGAVIKPGSWERVWNALVSVLRRLGFHRRQDLWSTESKRNFHQWSAHFPALDWMFEALIDDASRRLLIDLVAYRILGSGHVRLSLSTPAFWAQLAEVASLADEQDRIEYGTGGFTLMLHGLDKLGYPISLYAPKGGLLTTFVLRQYQDPRLGVGVRTGDVVIDAGACWGDTALLFAHLGGATGKIYSFEVMEDNIWIFKRNLGLNPILASRVELIARPLWSDSGTLMENSGAGPGNRAIPTHKDQERLSKGLHSSLSIDDFVKERSLSRIDLVKMDIEGSEFEALRGAKETLTAFKPDLALCVYHTMEDYFRLARYVDDLKLGYRFSLGHFSIHSEETVLFATARSELAAKN